MPHSKGMRSSSGGVFILRRWGAVQTKRSHWVYEILAAGDILWFRGEMPGVARAHVFPSVGWSIDTERSWTSMNAPTRFQFVSGGDVSNR